MKLQNLVAQARLDSPLGPMTVAATAQGLAGLWFDGQAHHPGPLDAPVDAQQPLHRAGRARSSSATGAAATRGRFKVPLDAQGTPFQQAVWRALLDIPAGRTSTYAAVAAAAGSARAVRAAGAAIGRNPLSIIVPCHRVLGRDGSLTGYAGGLERKQALLRTGRCAAGPAAARVKPRDIADLVLLAALWGASFLFMRVAVPHFGPLPLAALRVAGAALLLLPLLAWRCGLGGLRRHWRPIAVVGVTNSALPFLAFSLAALYIPAGLSSILNATSPMFGALDRDGLAARAEQRVAHRRAGHRLRRCAAAGRQVEQPRPAGTAGRRPGASACAWRPRCCTAFRPASPGATWAARSRWPWPPAARCRRRWCWRCRPGGPGRP